ncbi:YlxR family protein [Niameybacter massiliensis]|uniref:YlxR family protein n=1 Tax=Holtiella tumoricola TaxID=3018743 RepID=A0AA42DPZ6_9FIRM|nr:YlxR family protein [Holtiella tumoricola]MDA3732628.1 YlxR family protein [Holtiella tumoricola]
MKAKKIPLRKCTGCGEMKDKREMIRIVRDSEGNFSLDFTGKKAGRGAYICKNIDCLTQAEKNKGLERSYKTSVDKEIYNQLRKEFEANE